MHHGISLGLGGAVLALAVAAAGVAAADEARHALRQSIIAAGSTANERRTTGVEIDGCVVTTFAHENHTEFGWVLHTRWVFDLATTEVLMMNPNELKYPFYAAGGEGEGFGLVFLQPMPGAPVLHEVPNYRRHAKADRPSPREGADGYAFHESEDEFFILLESLPGPEQPERFAEGLIRYRRVYCLPTG